LPRCADIGGKILIMVRFREKAGVLLR